MFKTLMKQFGIDESKSIPKITPQNAIDQLSSGNAVLIDVREPDEWDATGSPKGCKQIALQNPDFVSEVLKEVNNDKDSKIIVCCKSGMRGEKAAKLLKADDFSNIVNVDGGVLRWISEKLPIN